MTKRVKQEDFVNDCQGRRLTNAEKVKFRTTRVWKEFRDGMFVKEVKTLKNGKQKIVPKVDELTLKPLTKHYNLHHLRCDSLYYADLDPNYFACLNQESHKVLHYVYTRYLQDKEYFDRLKALVVRMCELNDYQDFR